jgi:uncharacterized membrane protein
MSISHSPKQLFLAAAWSFLAVIVLGTLVGWLATLPASNGQHGDLRNVASQAVYGNGTATSPPLFITILLALCIVAAARNNGWLGRVGAVLTFLFAGFYVSAGELGELTTNTSPLTGAKWDLVLALGALGITIAALTILTGLWAGAATLRRKPRTSHQAA